MTIVVIIFCGMGKIVLIAFVLLVFLSGCNIGQEKISHDENVIERHTTESNYRIEKLSNGVYIYRDNIEDNKYNSYN